MSQHPSSDTASAQAMPLDVPAKLLTGRRVLVTGAARGLGLAFSKSIALAGGRVVLADILHDDVIEAAAKLRDAGFDADGVHLDLACPDSISACVRFAQVRMGGLDGLVNNAAITNSGGRDAHALDIDTWDRVMQVNVRGTWLLSRAAHGALKASGQGAIVNLSSDTALWGAPNLLAYVASKGAVAAMTRSLAREWGVDGITVNAVAPGLTRVEATEYVPRTRHEKYLEGRAIPREQEPADVCGAVIFSLSGLSRFVTGQFLPVNGGFVLN